MKLLLSSGSFYNEPLEKSFYIADKSGFDGVEVVMNEIYYREDVLDYLAELSKVAKIEAIHAPFMVEGSSKMKVVSLKKCIEICRTLNISKIVFHPPLRIIFEPYYWWWFMRQKFNHLKNDVELCLENMPFVRFGKKRISLWSIRRFKDLKKIAEKKGLFLAFDTTHCGTSGVPLVEAFEAMGGVDKVRHIHFSDFKEKNGKFFEHLFPGEGELPLFDFVEYLKAKGYTETITVEILPNSMPEDDIERIKKFKELIARIKG